MINSPWGFDQLALPFDHLGPIPAESGLEVA
jgi:hypothetical protein